MQAKKKKIYLFWFNKKGKYGNFGDECGPYIIKKLSGMEVYQIPIPRISLKLIIVYIRGLILKRYKLGIFNSVFKTLMLNGNHIISVGSIIGWGSGKRIVWGSGILFENENIDNGKFLAVRGKYTQKKLIDLGYNAPSIFGDPAILLPMVYSPEKAIQHDLGIIPHHTQYDHFKDYENKHELKVINLIGDVETIIDEIVSCRYIISSSLHGIIVAQAYNIPALWYEYPNIKWHGENIKFLDYFSSVGIEEYKPFPLKEIDDFNKEFELLRFKKDLKNSKITNDMIKIQKGLIDVAPFPVLSKFNI